ncbi:DUF262 domain-containing protein [Micromonospora humida]|uniref:DUF262 domain-containing protein n=1 Tax=Micromonospora humida TaxID=2809018 RepID=A0ABS2IW63_9ACTN|nr:DUF262 domain-containing protein [Micromonospora humida]MBM7078582.1 DUF262 domain-containing protein [Micromonospora humida]
MDEILRRIEKGRIDVAPSYQRKFQWDHARQSKLVESIFLGIPVPPLFMATNAEANRVNSWEVVDGLQRVTTLVNFAGNTNARSRIRLSDSPLALHDLDKLETFNGRTFSELPGDLQSLFEDRPLKVVVLNDKSEIRVRFDLFERLNTGGIRLSHQEVRECVFRGEFIDLLRTLSRNVDFRTVVRLQKGSENDGTPEEYVLRFFAYLENYKNFDHLVKDFLDEFTIACQTSAEAAKRSAIFEETFSYLAQCFPLGLKSRKGTTPVNLFEGVSVGAAIALTQRANLPAIKDPTWLSSDKLRSFVTGATNTRNRVAGRIEFCRDRFLEA